MKKPSSIIGKAKGETLKGAKLPPKVPGKALPAEEFYRPSEVIQNPNGSVSRRRPK